MYLKALEIQGFKSFPDKTVLTFGEDITAIVGPNGSGKSNISDAIRWVMGEMSSKALRGGKMEDVIFGGTQMRKQTGFAEVSLILDNTAHLFDLDESEVMVTRRYYRSGESEYYINKHSVRLRDINEMFMDTGLGREGYSIIGQGRIDEILSVKSSDRREIFEEAAGISRYRHRKEEAENKLKHTDDNLIRINDKIAELELQVEPLRDQAEKAKKYLVYRDEMRGLEISVWMQKLDDIKAANIKTMTDYENAVRQRDEIKANLDALYLEIENCSEQMHEMDIKADAFRSEQSMHEASISETESNIAVLMNNIKNNEENSKRVSQEMEDQGARANSVANQILQSKARIEAIVSEKKKCNERLQFQLAANEKLNENAGSIAKELEALREKENLQNASASEAKALLSALAAASQQLNDRKIALTREIDDGNARYQYAVEQEQESRKELTAAEENLESLLNIISGYRMRLEAKQRKAKDAAEAKNSLLLKENDLKHRINILSEMEKMHEGFTKAVKLVMNESVRGTLKNIYGPIAELIRVDSKYAVAIETALSGAMQNIVVEREEDAKAAITMLKKRDGGRATFEPLSVAKASYLKEDVSGEPGYIGIAADLVSYDKKYAGVVLKRLGRTVIVESMNDGISISRKFSNRFRIVTLDGQVFNADGSMTGGSSASKNAGILSRANELDTLRNKIETVRKDLQAATEASVKLDREVTAAEYELETAASQQREFEDVILKQKERCISLKNQIDVLNEQLELHKSELNNIKNMSIENDSQIESAKERIIQLEGEAESARVETQGKIQGQEDINDKRQQSIAMISDINAEIASYDAEFAAVNENLTQLELIYNQLKDDNKDRETLYAQFMSEIDNLKLQVSQYELLLEQQKKDNTACAEKLKKLNEDKIQLEGHRRRKENDSRNKNDALLSMEREVSVLEQKKISAAMEEKQILDKLWDSYELTHEAAQSLRQELESLSKAQKRISELKRAISALGNVNVGAIEEFERVNERYTYLTSQRDDVEKAKRELESIIGNITKEMTVIFAEQFKVINEAFEQTFVELFRGGKAKLELEDENDILNCGIEIKVQPPGKALKIISLLSGGEKAFVAIALYFAILKVRPTPFCVMDEIEAALDDANVVRFAKYMRNMSEKTQFITITHRRGTMEEADVLYGVTMQEQGVSKILTINLNDVEKELKIK